MVLVGRQPQVVRDEEHEMLIERVCAIDVGKKSGMVCVRVPDESRPGGRVNRVWEVPAITRAILELGDHLRCEQVQRVTVESTSDYWRIWYYLLEARGLDVQLVNSRDIKNVPGRPKTDKLDAVWQAKVTEKGLLRPSFVPPKEIRQLRDYTRLRVDLTRERTRHWARLEKLLEDALIKLSAVVSTLDLVSVRAMLEALIAGERNPLAQIEMLDFRIDQLIAAIPAARAPALDNATGQDRTGNDQTGNDQTGHEETGQGNAGQALSAVERLDEVTGIGRHAAQVIIAEVGLDMSRFPSPGHLAGWVKLCPRTIQSGAKHHTGKPGKGNPYLKGVLGDAAASVARTNTFLGERYRRIVKRRGKTKALVAVARSILVIVWHLLADPTARYHDLGADHHANRTSQNRQVRNHIRQLEALGYTVTLTEAG